MKKYVVSLIAIAALTFAFWSLDTQAQSGFKVIVHANNPVTSMSEGDVSNFFLKKQSRWDSGSPVEPIDLWNDSPVREVFSKAVHGRSVSSIKNYWQRQIFSGREVPPPEASSEAEVVAFVRSRPGAIGYVSSGTRLDGVKEVTVE